MPRSPRRHAMFSSSACPRPGRGRAGRLRRVHGRDSGRAGEGRGKAVGTAAAAGMLAMRTGDHFDDVVPYVQQPPGPGVFEPIAPTPPVDPKLAVRAAVHLRVAVGLPAGTAGLADEQALRGGRSGAAEVRPRSTAPSGVRCRPRPFSSTPSRPISSSAARSVSSAIARGLDLRESARMLGYINVATADTMIACWEAKYHYNFWRPNHAIQRADTDGNPATTKDTTWLPLVVGNHPEWPSGHACFTGSVTESLRQYFGTKTRQARDHEPRSGSGPTRTYENLDELVKDVENARVWGGLHYRTTMTEPPSTSRGSHATSASTTSSPTSSITAKNTTTTEATNAGGPHSIGPPARRFRVASPGIRSPPGQVPGQVPNPALGGAGEYGGVPLGRLAEVVGVHPHRHVRVRVARELRRRRRVELEADDQGATRRPGRWASSSRSAS